MTERLACSYSDAELNHLRDALTMNVSQRWAWLRQAMDFGFAVAQQRARRGLVTLDPHGEVLCSPRHPMHEPPASARDQKP
jgi:hypothetical protein